MSEEKVNKASSTLSKKRFYELSDNLKIVLGDSKQFDDVIETIKKVLHFDPDLKQYDIEQGRKNRERLKQKSIEEKKSLYELVGRKAHYYRQKCIDD